jgi:radical SAM superfamily enzyme YgiQ (UPF0313 family)
MKRRSVNRGLLLYPVGVCPANAYSSLPALAGYLRNQGHKVDVRDLNVEAYESWLGPESHVLYRGESGGRRLLPWSQEVSLAKGFMRGRHGEFCDARQYSEHRGVLEAALSHFSARYRNVTVNWGGYWRPLDRLDPDRLAELLLPGRDPVADFLLYRLDEVDFARYGWIGISITFGPQLVPSLLTALWIRRRGFRGRLVLGGACSQYIVDVFETHPQLFDFLDILIVREGESALLALSEDPRIPAADVTNAVARTLDGAVRLVGRCQSEDFAGLPAPDYAGMPLDLYFAPEAVMISAASRGCYFNRCAFCIPSFGRLEAYRLRGPDAVVSELRSLRSQTGSKYLFFADDCIPPSHLLRIWNSWGRDSPWSWQAEMRLEKALTFDTLRCLRRSGCVQLIFGLESANQRVLDSMVKGTRREIADRILSDCDSLGINVNVQTMIGFPRETTEEALETFDYLRSSSLRVSSFSMGPFRLLGRTAIAESPELFGVSEVTHAGCGSVHSYRAEKGLTSGEAETLSGVFYENLQKHYPVNKFFLDGPMGAHSLYYAARGKLPDMIREDAHVEPTSRQPPMLPD